MLASTAETIVAASLVPSARAGVPSSLNAISMPPPPPLVSAWLSQPGASSASPDHDC